ARNAAIKSAYEAQSKEDQLASSHVLGRARNVFGAALANATDAPTPIPPPYANDARQIENLHLGMHNRNDSVTPEELSTAMDIGAKTMSFDGFPDLDKVFLGLVDLYRSKGGQTEAQADATVRQRHPALVQFLSPALADDYGNLPATTTQAPGNPDNSSIYRRGGPLADAMSSAGGMRRYSAAALANQQPSPPRVLTADEGAKLGLSDVNDPWEAYAAFQANGASLDEELSEQNRDVIRDALTAFALGRGAENWDEARASVLKRHPSLTAV
ncbi:MAG TPA: hypothetical protein VFB72_16615, partial [Verrucomicrobiae bacterium]|nr:hypothetical protein [Verrucomicrobiae bacterium]